MIAIAKPTRRQKQLSGWQQGFLSMMPDIIKSAHIAFRNLKPEARQEAIQEVLVNAMLAYIRLFEQKKVDVAYASALARFAIAQYRAGRRVSTKLNCNDVLSPYAQKKKKFRVETLTGGRGDHYSWRELLQEKREAGPAETAAARIDITEWFEALSGPDREIANSLSMGYSTKEVAKEYQVSAPRISQKRREFLDSWQGFQGEETD